MIEEILAQLQLKKGDFEFYFLGKRGTSANVSKERGRAEGLNNYMIRLKMDDGSYFQAYAILGYKSGFRLKVSYLPYDIDMKKKKDVLSNETYVRSMLHYVWWAWMWMMATVASEKWEDKHNASS